MKTNTKKSRQGLKTSEFLFLAIIFVIFSAKIFMIMNF